MQGLQTRTQLYKEVRASYCNWLSTQNPFKEKTPLIISIQTRIKTSPYNYSLQETTELLFYMFSVWVRFSVKHPFQRMPVMKAHIAKMKVHSKAKGLSTQDSWFMFFLLKCSLLLLSANEDDIKKIAVLSRLHGQFSVCDNFCLPHKN